MPTYNRNQVFEDSTTSVVDQTDNTKVAQFQSSGIATGTTRTFTFPDFSSTLITATTNPSATQAIVGTGGYATVGAAVTAGEINILVKSNVTELADITLAADTYILIGNGVNLNMDVFQFLGTGTIIFDTTNAGTITYAFTTSKTLVSGLNTKARNIIIDNNSTIGSTQFAASGDGQNYQNVSLLLPNFVSAGITITSPNPIVKGLFIQGGGAACTNGLVATAAIVEGVILTGTWNTTTGNYAVQLLGNTVASDFINSGTTTANISLSTSELDGLRIVTGGIGTRIELNGSNCSIQSADIGTSDLDFNGQVTAMIDHVRSTGNIVGLTSAADGNFMSDCSFTGTGAITIAGSNNRFVNTRLSGAITTSATGTSNQFSNCLLTSTVTTTAAGIFNQFDNCMITGSVTTAGDDCSFSNCRVGAEGGGGATTITISAGADRTRVTGTATDDTISDAGTASALSNNTIY